MYITNHRHNWVTSVSCNATFIHFQGTRIHPRLFHRIQAELGGTQIHTRISERGISNILIVIRSGEILVWYMYQTDGKINYTSFTGKGRFKWNPGDVSRKQI